MEKRGYILAFGYRRLTACKKLGWVTMPCKIQGIKTELLEIEIKDITVLDNTRIETEDNELKTLMLSIKQHGLLQPIGVWREGEFSNEDFLILNLIENEHRVDSTPLEFARGCNLLRKKGLNIGEIAVRLSVSPNKVKTALKLVSGSMKKHLKNVSFIENRTVRGGKLPFAALNTISYMRIADKDKDKLINETKKRELTVNQIKVISNILKTGIPLEKALDNLKDYHTYSTVITLNKKEYLKLSTNYSFSNLLRKHLRGEELLNKELFV